MAMAMAGLLRFFVVIVVVVASLIGSAAATLVHQVPRDQLKKRLDPVPTPLPPKFVPVFNPEQKEYLDAHNALRRKVGVPPLAWSADLTAEAHAWAEERRRDCNFRRHSHNQYGENIYWMKYKQSAPTQVVQWWFNEQKFYNHSKLLCTCQPERPGCECGHYLNIVWATTRQVGCSGATYCDNQRGIYVVCEYNPAGLIPGINPFTGLKL